MRRPSVGVGEGAAWVVMGVNFMPHFGQRPGSADVTSGCIGQA